MKAQKLDLTTCEMASDATNDTNGEPGHRDCSIFKVLFDLGLTACMSAKG